MAGLWVKIIGKCILKFNVSQDGDYSFENRLFGTLGLQDVKFEYAFTDDFDPQTSHVGPGADAAIQRELAHVFE